MMKYKMWDETEERFVQVRRIDFYDDNTATVWDRDNIPIMINCDSFIDEQIKDFAYLCWKTNKEINIFELINALSSIKRIDLEKSFDCAKSIIMGQSEPLISIGLHNRDSDVECYLKKNNINKKLFNMNFSEEFYHRYKHAMYELNESAKQKEVQNA